MVEFFLSFYLFIFRERRREGEREGEKHQCVRATPSWGTYLAHNPSMCPGLFVSGMIPNPLSHTSPGKGKLFS